MLMGGEVDLQETWTVLGALPLLANVFRNVTLDVVGGGAALVRLRQLASDMNLADRVTFHGSVSRERALELLAGADVFCCLPAAETEGFRQAVVEALACGLPVVTTRTSISSMLMSEGCGTIMHERTPEALAAAVKVCLTDHSRYRSMSARALRTAQACSLERWRDMLRVTLEAAWGPLRSKPTAVGV
ncbi:MAG TPA: glycosyltransferase [Gemmatimonadales bacterium]|nr:glycosyltransferase [Gemmatimonadales bacterium]